MQFDEGIDRNVRDMVAVQEQLLQVGLRVE